MAYFRQNSRQGSWAQQEDDSYDDDYEEFDDDDEYLTEEEWSDLRQHRFRVAAGLLDFLGVVAGTVVILLLVALLVNIITWLQADMDQMFTSSGICKQHERNRRKFRWRRSAGNCLTNRWLPVQCAGCVRVSIIRYPDRAITPRL